MVALRETVRFPYSSGGIGFPGLKDRGRFGLECFSDPDASDVLVPASVPAEAEDDSRAESEIVLLVAVGATVLELRIEILCLKETNSNVVSQFPVYASACGQ
jgi:hypothetical protein